MKRVIAILGVGIITIGFVLYSRHTPSNSSVSELAASGQESGQVASAPPERQSGADRVAKTLEPALKPKPFSAPVPEVVKSATPFLLGSADTPPAMSPDIVLGKMRTVIHQYASMFGANPVGTNPEITEALNGGNPRQARL